MYTEDTITAISTPIGTSGIGVIRVSGKKAIKIVNKIFQAKNKKNLEKVPTHTVHLGYIVRNKTSEIFSNKQYNAPDIIDEVLVTVMRGPNSYTGEDVIEISCHGGIVPLEEILSLLLYNGARLASAGEFTKRAFLNGKLDLIQAEAICDIINAKTNTSLQVAIHQLYGSLSDKVNDITDKIADIVANLNAILDYPEESIPDVNKNEIIRNIDEISYVIERLLGTSNRGRILREGLKIAIVGRPNVGKSTLLNTLLQQDKAIVTSIPGTTRDVVEGWLDIKGVPVKAMDTAGVKIPKDEIEELGIQRSKKAVEEADIVLFVIDLSSKLNKEDKNIFGIISKKTFIIVENKKDLPLLVKEKDIRKLIPGYSHHMAVKTSAIKGEGIQALKDAIYKSFTYTRTKSPESIFVTNIRHQDALKRAKSALLEAKNTCKNNGFYEFVVMDLRMALNTLGEITGVVSNEEILDRIFSKFCVGK